MAGRVRKVDSEYRSAMRSGPASVVVVRLARPLGLERRVVYIAVDSEASDRRSSDRVAWVLVTRSPGDFGSGSFYTQPPRLESFRA